MKPVVVVADEKGRISLSVEELSKMLNDAYEQGKADGMKSYLTYPPNCRDVTTPAWDFCGSGSTAVRALSECP